MVFFLLFPLKIGILHFCELLENKGGSPMSKNAFLHKHRVMNNIQKNLGNPIPLTKLYRASLIVERTRYSVDVHVEI